MKPAISHYYSFCGTQFGMGALLGQRLALIITIPTAAGKELVLLLNTGMNESTSWYLPWTAERTLANPTDCLFHA